MPITAAALKIFAAETMDDTPTGGGRRGAAALLTGVQNNVFPDATADDFLSGRVKVRKVYPSVLATDAAALQSATLRVNAPPGDPLVEIALASFGTDAARRAEFEAGALPAAAAIPNLISLNAGATTWAQLSFAGVISGGSAALTLAANPARNSVNNQILAGGATPAWLALYHAAGVHVSPVLSILPGPTTPDAEQTYALAQPFPGAGAAVPVTVRAFWFPTAAQRFFGVASLRTAPAASDTTLELARSLARVCPNNGGAFDLSNRGLQPASLVPSNGHVPILAPGDLATLYHEAQTTPATQANGSVVNCGRGSLAQIALVAASGVEIGRVLAGGEPPAAGLGFTVNLSAGTLTCTNVTGWAQPVSVRHRIEERVSIAAAQPSNVALGAPLARSFPAGSMLSTELPLGDLQPGIGPRFSQQAWTRVWSDSLVGAAIGNLYPGQIGLQADGAETDRFAAVFTSATQYTLHSERWGVVGSGNVGSDYVPLNPHTGQPLLTLYAAEWAAGGIALGNVLRFNVRGACAGAWVVQCIRPGSGSAGSAATLVVRGNADA